MARNKYPEETLHRIIQTSKKLFLTKGYEQTTIQDIINELGDLSKGAIYHHFKSKDDIMDAVAEDLYSNTNSKILEIKHQNSYTGLKKIQSLFLLSLENPNQVELLSSAPNLMQNPRFFTEQVFSGVRDVAPIIQEFIEEGITDGSVKTEYPKELSEVLILLANTWLNPAVFFSTKEEFLEKLRFFKYMTRLLEVPLISPEIEKHLISFQDLLDRLEK